MRRGKKVGKEGTESEVKRIRRTDEREQERDQEDKKKHYVTGQ